MKNGDEAWSYWASIPEFKGKWFDKQQSWVKLQNTYRKRFGREMPAALRKQLLKDRMP